MYWSTNMSLIAQPQQYVLTDQYVIAEEHQYVLVNQYVIQNRQQYVLITPICHQLQYDLLYILKIILYCPRCERLQLTGSRTNCDRSVPS